MIEYRRKIYPKADSDSSVKWCQEKQKGVLQPINFLIFQLKCRFQYPKPNSPTDTCTCPCQVHLNDNNECPQDMDSHASIYNVYFQRISMIFKRRISKHQDNFLLYNWPVIDIDWNFYIKFKIKSTMFQIFLVNGACMWFFFRCFYLYSF